MLENLDLFKLHELKTINDSIIEKLANELTTYAEMNNDHSFHYMPHYYGEKYDKHKKYVDFSSKLQKLIEDKIDEFIND